MPPLAASAAFVSLALAPLVVGLAGCPTAVAQPVTVENEAVASTVRISSPNRWAVARIR